MAIEWLVIDVSDEQLHSTDLVVMLSYFVTITLRSTTHNNGVIFPCIYNGDDEEFIVEEDVDTYDRMDYDGFDSEGDE